MSSSETLSGRPKLGTGVAVALIVLAGILIFIETRHGGEPDSGNAKGFFTVDDGRTWFADDITRLPPFEKDGKQAVRAFVFRCGSGTEFVGYLQRFTPQGKQAIEKLQSPDPNRTGPPDSSGIRMAYSAGREVKRPGDAKWISGADGLESLRITKVTCPNGGGDAVMVEP